MFKKITNSDHISSWKSKGLSDESIKPSAAHNNNLAPVTNIYVIYGIKLQPFNVGKDFVLRNSLLGAVKFTKFRC